MASWLPPPFSDEMPEALAPEVRAERIEAMAAWVLANPEAIGMREQLVDRLTSHDQEAAAEALAGIKEDFAPSGAAQVAVETAPWRVVVAFAQYYDTSEDWAFFVNDVFTASKPHAIGTDYIDKGAERIEVVRRGITVATLPLAPDTREPFAQGYVAAMEGKEPIVLGHDLSDAVLEQLSEYFELRLQR